mmetsp:Transcript_57356/g.171058  ORF Transcript_57356/g.171058 Transcript_57356/m.171058 type:complete len:228 (+) Transcript_57356:206-889(+)
MLGKHPSHFSARINFIPKLSGAIFTGILTKSISPFFFKPSPLNSHVVNLSASLLTKIFPASSATGSPGHWCAPNPPGNQLPGPFFSAVPLMGHLDSEASLSAAVGDHRSGSNRSGSGNSAGSMFPMRGSSMTGISAGIRYPSNSKSSFENRGTPAPGGSRRSVSRSTPSVYGRPDQNLGSERLSPLSSFLRFSSLRTVSIMLASPASFRSFCNISAAASIMRDAHSV